MKSGTRVPPLRTSSLLSRRYIRARLQQATTARVSPSVVDRIEEALMERFEHIVAATTAAHQREVEALAIQGILEHQPVLKIRHVRI